MATMTPEESFALATQQEPTAGDLAAAGEPVAVEPAAPAAEEPTAAAPEPPKVNPNWEEAWADVPEPIRAQQQAVFQKWDSNYNSLQARHAPYAQFEERGYNPQYIGQALEIQQALAEDPEGFIRRAAEHFGITMQQAAAAAVQASQQQEEVFSDPLEQRLAQYEARLQRQEQEYQQRIQQEQAQQQNQQYAQQVAGMMANLHTKYGDFDDEQVARWAIMNASTGRNADLEVALNEMRAWEADVILRNQRTAPKVLGAAGGTASFTAPPEPPRLLTDDERLAKALEVARQLAEG